MQTDNALSVLLEIYEKEVHEFSRDLLISCYETQRQYQFDRDRDVPMENMRRLIEAEVTRLLDTEGSGK